MVTRYEPMAVSRNGEYVTYEDYCTLEEEYEREKSNLLSKIDSLHDEISDLNLEYRSQEYEISSRLNDIIDNLQNELLEK